MDPVFSVLLDVVRLAIHQPPATKQTWGAPERIEPPETICQAGSELASERGALRWLHSFSLWPR
jgi:hypothetical protein